MGSTSDLDSKPKRRGRPIADDDRGDEALKARRERNREAQHIFRRRKQAAEAAQGQRMRRLEEVVEEMSSIFLGNVDEMLLSKAAAQDPNLVANVRGSVAKVLSLAKEVAGTEDEDASASSASCPDRSSSPEEGSSSSSGASADIKPSTTPLAIPGMLCSSTTCGPAGQRPLPIPPQIYGNGWLNFPNTSSLLDHSSNAIRLSPESFPLRLVDVSVAKSYLLLLSAGDSHELVGDVRRIFNASIRFSTRDELLYRMRWLLGPGRSAMHRVANASFGDVPAPSRMPSEGISAIDVLAASFFPYTGEAKDKFFNAMGVQRQLESLGAKMVDRDTMEITVPCPRSNQQVSSTMSLGALLEHQQQPEYGWGYIGGYPTGTSPSMSTLTMRVSASLLIESLSHVSMCLARGPGFPRHEIYRAVETAVTMVYGGDTPGGMDPQGGASFVQSF